MKQILTFIIAAVLLAACTSKEHQLRERASVLCQYLPNTDLQETSKAFMTADALFRDLQWKHHSRL